MRFVRSACGALGLVVSLPAVADADGSEPSVVVHVDEGPQALVLQRLADREDDSWTNECHDSCDRPVREGTYRVRGPDVRPSQPFELSSREGQRVAITPRVASQTRHTYGITLLGFGIASGVVGTGFVIGGAAAAVNDSFGCIFQPSCTRPDNHSVPLVVGFVATGVGVALMTAGLVLALLNADTRVTLVPQAPSPVLKLPERGSTLGALDTPAMSPLLSVPVFGVSF